MQVPVKSTLFLIAISCLIALRGSQASTTSTTSTSSSAATSTSTTAMTTSGQTTAYGQNTGSKAVTPSVLAMMTSAALILVVNHRY